MSDPVHCKSGLQDFGEAYRQVSQQELANEEFCLPNLKFNAVQQVFGWIGARRKDDAVTSGKSRLTLDVTGARKTACKVQSLTS